VKPIKLTEALKKEIQVAFWGKNYEVSYILKDLSLTEKREKEK